MCLYYRVVVIERVVVVSVVLCVFLSVFVSSMVVGGLGIGGSLAGWRRGCGGLLIYLLLYTY